MKLTNRRLKKIIKEEIEKLAEAKDPSEIFDDSLEGLIKEYFYRSLVGKWDDPHFWDQLFGEMRPWFRNKSVEHGFLGAQPYGEFLESLGMGPRELPEEMVWDLQEPPYYESASVIPDMFTLDNDWIQITKQEIWEYLQNRVESGMMATRENLWGAIMEYHVERLQDRFGDGIHGDIYQIYLDMQDWKSLPIKERIRLADRAIHAEHETGDVLDIYSGPDELRREAEEAYEQQARSKVANVYADPRFI